MNTCTVCGVELHGARHDWTVCEPCEAWLRDHLNTVEHLWLELPRHLVPAGRRSGQRVSGSPQAGRIPPSETVLNLLGPGGVPDRLAFYDRAVRTHRGLTVGRPAGSLEARLGAAVKSLRNHLGWACQHYPELHPLAVELRELVGEMRAATGDTGDTVALGPCPQANEDGSACDAYLRYNRERHSVRCYNGHQVDVAAYIRPAA